MTADRDEYERQRRTRERHRRQQLRKRRIRRIWNLIFCTASVIMILAVIGIARSVLPGMKGKENVPAAAETVKEVLWTEAEEKEDRVREDEMPEFTAELPEDSVEAYLPKLIAMEKEDARIREVVEHADEYDWKLLRMLCRNIETLDFMLDYPEKKDLPCEESIGEEENEEAGGIPLLIQWDERWGYGHYGDSVVAVSGCGPTCLAMVASGLTGRKDITPYVVARYSEENGYLSAENDTAWSLMTEGCQHFGLIGTQLGLDETAMANTLDLGYPIICSVGPGDFTENGHFIVLTGYENGAFHVNDPNSRIRSGRTWTFEELQDQIWNLWYFEVSQ